jgi:hypothetical protein
MSQHFTSVARGLNMGSFVESKEEFLEKGKKAQIGEIREWKGQKFQKQPNGGWIPVKQGTKDSKKEEGFDWKKVTVKDMAGVPVGTKISFEDDLSGTRVVAEKVKDNSWKNEEGNTFTDGEMVESVSHPDAHDHKIEKPAAKKEEGGPKTFVDEKYGRKDKFEVVDEWPSGGYKVWNIGRSNFPHEGYIPLAQSTPENKYVVKLDTLKALKVGDEDLCLKVLKAAGQKGVDEEKFNKLKEEHKGKSPEKKEEPGKEALSEISKK